MHPLFDNFNKFAPAFVAEEEGFEQFLEQIRTNRRAKPKLILT